MVALVFVMDSYWTWCELQHDFLPTRELAGFGERREVQSITGAVAQNLRFPGQYFQLETGLAYNWHRTYDPVTGRYTQPDPLRFVDGPAIYQYAMASPFMRTDRTGLEYCPPGLFSLCHGSIADNFPHGGVIADGPGGVVTVYPPGANVAYDQDVDFVCIRGEWIKILTGRVTQSNGVTGGVMIPPNRKVRGDPESECWVRDNLRGNPKIATLCGCGIP
jgi:RHS repeat-associated protein